MLDSPTSPDHVYRAVRAHVLALVRDISEPVRVREEELARKLGVSRTPVREALLRLGQEGILTMERHRGALLSPLTHEQYLEWLKLRVELEGFAAREAAMNASQRDVDALRKIFAPFNDENLDVLIDEYSAANVDFHIALIRLASNGLLEKVWELFGHRDMLKTKTIKRLNRGRQSLSDHLALIDAIERRDAAEAERIARSHVEELLNHVSMNSHINEPKNQ
ncbi:GntR family transcriptional regulator [Achromobacter aegrifaciens]|uniref:GntR family transcriptional regulator n=1 Tax=Achromobacter aegrifaciens TaxID=1287736 RepID=UPI0007512C59|nr:GntR family transcriptional regulator [Achromobacter aegrifaciens]WLW61049.1 GntR family transcriptional regulator [Achromobacter aegrifaciens]